MALLRKTAQAEADLIAIWVYIAQDNLSAALASMSRYAAFVLGLVTGPVDPGRQHGHPIRAGRLGIGGIEIGLVVAKP